MTDADRKTWERVATRIGVWKPDVKCKLPCGDSDHYGRSSGNLWGHQQPRSNPCPDPSDPAMIVAMLEWLIQFLKDHPEDRSWADVGAYTVYEDRPLHVALINVITVLPQEARNG